MKYCDILKDSGAKKISQPIWNEKFRMPLLDLRKKLLMHLILNEETNLMTDKEDFFLSTLYLFNMNFERPTELIIDLYKESIQTGAQIIIDIEFQWFEFTKPIEELQEVTEVLKQQLNILGEDKVLYLSQIKSLLEPFDINHYRWAENSSSLSYQTNLIDQSRRKNYNNNKNNKNIFYFSDRKSNIIDDCLLYSGVRQTTSQINEQYEDDGCIDPQNRGFNSIPEEDENMHSFLNLNINQNESLYGKKTPDLTEQNQNNDSMKKNHNAYSFYGKPQIKKNSPYIKAHYQIEESPEIENEINNDQKKNHNPLNFIGKPSIKKNSAYIKSLIHTEDEDIFDVESKKNIKEMDDESFNLEKNHNKKKNEEKKKIESNFTNKDKKTVSTPERERKYQNSIINTKPKNESTKKSNLVNSALPILFEPQNNKINQEINKEKKNEAEVNKQKQGNQNEDSNFTNERQNNSANEEKKKPVYHTKPLLKIEKQMLVHKALVVSDKFPHYVHPERASKKFKKN